VHSPTLGLTPAWKASIIMMPSGSKASSCIVDEGLSVAVVESVMGGRGVFFDVGELLLEAIVGEGPVGEMGLLVLS